MSGSRGTGRQRIGRLWSVKGVPTAITGTLPILSDVSGNNSQAGLENMDLDDSMSSPGEQSSGARVGLVDTAEDKILLPVRKDARDRYIITISESGQFVTEGNQDVARWFGDMFRTLDAEGFFPTYSDVPDKVVHTWFNLFKEKYCTKARNEAISEGMIEPDAPATPLPFLKNAWKEAVTEGKKPKGDMIPGFGNRGAGTLNLPTARTSKTSMFASAHSSDREKDELIENLTERLGVQEKMQEEMSEKMNEQIRLIQVEMQKQMQQQIQQIFSQMQQQQSGNIPISPSGYLNSNGVGTSGSGSRT